MAGNIVKIQIKADADTRAIEQVKAQLASLRNKTVKVNIDVDQDKLRSLDRLGDKRRKLTYDLDIDQDAWRELGGRTATIEVDADTASAEGQIAAAARDRSATINIRTNRSEIDRLTDSVASATRSVTNLGESFTSGASNSSRFFNRVSRIAPLVVALAPAVATLASGAIGAGVYGVAAALGTVTGVAGGLGAAVTAGIAAIPIAAAAASQEVKDHFSYMGSDVVRTMQDIAVPVRKPLVDLATATGAAFHQMRPNLEAITQGTAGLVNTLSASMPAIASKLGPALQQAFQAGVPHMENLIGSMPRLSESIGQFFGSLGSPAVVEGAKRIFEQTIPNMIQGAGTGIEKLAGGFNAVMGFLDSGRMDGFGEGISNFFSNMANTDWSGVTNAIANAGNAFGNFMGSIDGEALAGNLEGLTQFAADLTNVASEMGSAFNSLNEGFSGLNANIGGGPIEWGGKLAEGIKSVWDSISGGQEMTIEAKLAIAKMENPELDPVIVDGEIVFKNPDPQVERNTVEVPGRLNLDGAMDGQALRNLDAVPLPTTPQLQGEVPELPPATLPTTPQLEGQVPQLPPAQQPVTPFLEGQLPQLPPATQPVQPELQGEIPQPDPITVQTEVANGEVAVTPPPPVPITFNVTQPVLQLTPPPPVPITFNVALPTITIAAPPPVQVTVNVPTVVIPLPSGLSVAVTVTSNAAAIGAQISALAGMNTSSTHTVTTNAASAAAEINSLNGMNTSSTHTINVVQNGDIPGGRAGGR